jgi:hypothetical protein
MSEEENMIKGGVIIIGSLRWENESNAIQDDESKALAKKRENWRNTYLDLDPNKKENPQLPICYGRCSSSRKCTYTMVFSSLAMNNQSFGLAIPYKSEIDFSNYLHFERQARILADVEGISKNNDNRLRKSWGCIGIYINPNSPHSAIIHNHWDNLRMTDNEYSNKLASNYSFRNLHGDNSLLESNYQLKQVVHINTKIDFLFFTYIKPEHRNKAVGRYPTPQEIAEEINRSGYKTYFEENKKSGITTFEDNDIDNLIV